MVPRKIALWVAKSYHGRWYTWGGDDPSGFDCSGLIVECLKSAGVLPRGVDLTAHGLYDRFIKANHPAAGRLVFWGSENKVTHVEMCINQTFSIGASGGGSNTRTLEDAIRHNAFIKIRPIARDRHLVGYVEPFVEV